MHINLQKTSCFSTHLDAVALCWPKTFGAGRDEKYFSCFMLYYRDNRKDRTGRRDEMMSFGGIQGTAVPRAIGGQ